MRLSDSKLRDLIAACRTMADADMRSELDNFWFEERVSTARQQAFEDILGGFASWDEFRRRHSAYYRTFVIVDESLLPHTFMSDFICRDLTKIDEEQVVVRVESLVRPLSASGLTF